MIGPAIYLGAVAALSVLGALMIAWDKRQARLGRWRTPESTLHTVELLGGFPGVLLARRLLRHKTRKRAYRLLAAAAMLAHLAVAGAVFYFIYAD